MSSDKWNRIECASQDLRRNEEDVWSVLVLFQGLINDQGPIECIASGVQKRTARL